MTDKKYLTEETYQKGKRTLKLVATIILVASLLIGGTLIILGITSSSASAVSLSEMQEVIESEKSDDATSTINEDFEAASNRMQEEYEKAVQQQKEAYDERVQQQKEESEKQLEQAKEEAAKVLGTAKRTATSGIMIFLGIQIILWGAMISGILFFIAHRREIAAFTTQQTLPLKKEKIETMTPTVAKAAGTVTESVAEGITRGIKNAKADKTSASEKSDK